jgi:hypothetical protein
MRLPTQAVPVQRAIVGFTNQGANSPNTVLSSLYAPSNGVVGSDGVDAAGWLDDLGSIVKTVGQVAGTAGPIIGALAGI